MKQNLILGPPGCGKTTYLLNKVQEEMENGCHPSRIAFVSFTRKAANEAITRALTKFNITREEFPFFRTLHSLAYQQLGLRREQVMGARQYQALGLALGLTFSDYMDFEEGLPVSAKSGDQVLYIVSMARATLRTLQEQFDAYLSGEVSWFRVKQFADALAEYKRSTQMLDFSDMLDNFVDQCQPLDIDVALIDEAQDLSRQQWKMVRHAASRAKTVYIGGDDDQAIYRWSGADVDSFLNLPGDKIVLQQSYRLPRIVHGLVSRLSQRISQRYQKVWQPRDEEGSMQYLAALGDMEWLPGSYLLLARNRYLLERLEGFVRTSGIPYTIGNRSSVDPEAVAAIKGWERLRRGDALTADEVRGVYKFLRTGNGIKRGHKRLKGVADESMLVLKDLQDTHGLLRTDLWYEALDMIPAEEREFYQAALRRKEKLTRPPRVHISTIHGIKGGEADHVLVMSDMAGRTYSEFNQHPDDEHRVAYVAASRARQSLSILLPQTLRAYDYR